MDPRLEMFQKYRVAFIDNVHERSLTRELLLLRINRITADDENTLQKNIQFIFQTCKPTMDTSIVKFMTGSNGQINSGEGYMLNPE